jgi:hypothetical protein
MIRIRSVVAPAVIVACIHAVACVGSDAVLDDDASPTPDGGTPPGAEGGTSDGSSVTPDDGSVVDSGTPGVDANPGPFYVFVTNGKWRGGDLGGLAGADSKCASEASTFGLPGKYVAWLSTSTVNAINRVPASGGPWLRRQDDAVVIGNRSQLAGGGGVTVPVALGGMDWVWTSTMANGEAVYLETTPRDYQTCEDWTSVSTSESGYGGEAAKAGDAWNYGHSMTCDAAYSIYCLRSQ